MDQVKILFNCDICNELLVDPVTIPCGNTLCKVHLDELLTSDNVFKCILCHKKHNVPEDGFIVNKRIQNALYFEKIKLTPGFLKCKQKIEEATEQASKIESIKKYPAGYITEHFDIIKSHVNWRREEIKADIDKYADEMIQKIETSKINCMDMSKENSQLTSRIEESTRELENLKKRLDTFEIDHLNFKNIEANADDLKEKLNRILVQYKESLIIFNDYVFVYEDYPLEDLFGRFKEKVKHDFI